MCVCVWGGGGAEPRSALQESLAAAMEKGKRRAEALAAQAEQQASAPLPMPAAVDAPAGEVAAWLRAGMAASAPRTTQGTRGTTPGQAVFSERLKEEEQARGAKAARAWDVEAAAKARAEMKAEHDAEALARTNNALRAVRCPLPPRTLSLSSVRLGFA
jgi:hypothetical protein